MGSLLLLIRLKLEKNKNSIKTHNSENVRKCMRECELKIEDRPTDYVQRYLIGLNMVIKRVNVCSVNDIRRCTR